MLGSALTARGTGVMLAGCLQPSEAMFSICRIRISSDTLVEILILFPMQRSTHAGIGWVFRVRGLAYESLLKVYYITPL